MTSAPRRPSFGSDRPTRPAPPATNVRTASPKAEAFWASLREDLAALVDELAALGQPPAITVPADVEVLPAEQASREIDEMLAGVRALRTVLAQARRMATKTADAAATAATDALEVDRLYEMDGEIYRTYLSGAGNLYVKIWTTDGWDYAGARGALRHLRPEHRMSVERAKELSIRWAQCIRCGAELTADVSVERGIGPVCITKI
jgi:hypothetical protein